MSQTIHILNKGDRFNQLTFIEITKRTTDERYKTRIYCLCQCDCGKITTVEKYNLISGKTQSCGCYRRKLAGGKNRGKKQERPDVFKGVKDESFKQKTEEMLRFNRTLKTDKKQSIIDALENDSLRRVARENR
jgi:hypothetical protein